MNRDSSLEGNLTLYSVVEFTAEPRVIVGEDRRR